MFPRPALGLNALRYAPPAAFTVQHPYLKHDVTKSPKVRTVLSLTRHISDSSAIGTVRTAFLAAQSGGSRHNRSYEGSFCARFLAGLLRLATWNRKHNWTGIAGAQSRVLGATVLLGARFSFFWFDRI